MDAIADVPVPQLFPLIYGAYGSGTKVILTMRSASEWVERRDRWMANGEHGVSDVAPMGTGLASSIANATLMRDGVSVHEARQRSSKLTAYSYLAMSSLVRRVRTGC